MKTESETLARLMLKKIIEEVAVDPGKYNLLINAYLPFLVSYTLPFLRNKVDFAVFKSSLYKRWKESFGENVPPPDLTAAIDYEGLQKAMLERLNNCRRDEKCRKELYAKLGFTGLIDAIDVQRALLSIINTIIFDCIVDVLNMRGEI